MNCKQGDLAIVVVPSPIEGTLVRCLRFAGSFPVEDVYGNEGFCDESWEVEYLSLATAEAYGEYPMIPDGALRPIRGTPETEDEDQREPVAA